jgi:iron complex outermembrane receptor protein
MVTGVGLNCPLVAVAQTQDGQSQQSERAHVADQTPEVVAQPAEAAAAATPDSEHTPTPAPAPAAPPPPGDSDQAPETTTQPPETAPPTEASQSAEAAPAPEPPRSDGEAPNTGIETVVVTARRSAEDIQKVPIAITAFSAKELERQQINSGQDLAGKVPSLVIGTGGQTRNAETPTIRGQGATFGAAPGVVIYYGEVPLPMDQFNNGQGGPGKFFDLANLQVLKGSQGTLFGRNTTGGALILEPHKPDQFYSGDVKVEVGDYAAKGLEAILNVPITDSLAVRFGAKYYERGGFTKDVVTGEDYDNKGFRTFRLGALWKPTDSISNYLLGYYTHSADNGTSEVIESINSNVYFPNLPQFLQRPGCDAVFASGDHTGTCGQDVIAAQQARGVRSVALDNPGSDILDTQALIDNFSYKITDELTLRNIASYSLYKHSFRWDADGSNLPINNLGYPISTNSSDTSTYTEELQLQGDFRNHNLKVVEGLYYEYMEPNSDQEMKTRNLGVTANVSEYKVSHRTFGPYAQATYDLGDLFDSLNDLNLTAGVRYSVADDFGSASVLPYIQGTTFPIPTQGAPLHYVRTKSEAPTYTVGMDYKLATTLVYGKLSRGYKSGGVSTASVNSAYFTFKPEFVFNYEIGSKSDFSIGDMPVRWNTAVYYTDYTNMQRAAGNSYKLAFGSAVYNAGRATIEGLETDVTAQPLQLVTTILSYSYTLGKYNDYSIIYGNALDLPATDCMNNTVRNGQTMNLNCVPFAYTPRHQGNATIRVQIPVPESIGGIDVSTTYSYIDKQYADAVDIPAQSPGAWLGGYGLLSARAGWAQIFGSNFDLDLFGTNLTDRTYRISNSNQWTLFFFQGSIYGEPRMYGASLTYRFDK